MEFPEDTNSESRELYNASISKLNLEALRRVATEYRGIRCVGCEAIAQGGYNTVFLLKFEDGHELIARLGGSRSGQDEGVREDILTHRLKSEVVTMRYIETQTSIPIPHIHLVEYDAQNSVGTRFMLMDKIAGSTLNEVWDAFTPEEREQVVRQLVGFQAELLKLEFPAIGSLLDDQGTLGPLSRSCSYPSLLSLDCGPFKTTKDSGVPENPENWQKQRKETANLSGGLEDTPIEDAREWLRLLHEGIRGLRDDILDKPESPFVLFHDDFQWSNALVSPEDPTKLVGILD
ncbi:hypothetical protein ARMGADRAFT_1165711 [Armillaria gallica]|uniref:Aminoglycoside phosphotransferase domain-containing protein n=1 Tax=Armillaria gallica TaxID=47427 RepID=A0A2H3DBM5_ARMGA|nr:hypothetical protein ARMGADRAFT_1165711 [Armillaria gallica]